MFKFVWKPLQPIGEHPHYRHVHWPAKRAPRLCPIPRWSSSSAPGPTGESWVAWLGTLQSRRTCTITKCLNNYVLIYILNGSLVSKLPSCGRMVMVSLHNHHVNPIMSTTSSCQPHPSIHSTILFLLEHRQVSPELSRGRCAEGFGGACARGSCWGQVSIASSFQAAKQSLGMLHSFAANFASRKHV